MYCFVRATEIHFRFIYNLELKLKIKKIKNMCVASFILDFMVYIFKCFLTALQLPNIPTKIPITSKIPDT